MYEKTITRRSGAQAASVFAPVRSYVKNGLDWGEFGAALRKKRRGMGWSYRQLAKQIAVDPMTVHRVENGGSCGTDAFFKLSNFVDCDPRMYLK
jgi:hypothetical protein